MGAVLVQRESERHCGTSISKKKIEDRSRNRGEMGQTTLKRNPPHRGSIKKTQGIILQSWRCMKKRKVTKGAKKGKRPEFVESKRCRSPREGSLKKKKKKKKKNRKRQKKGWEKIVQDSWEISRQLSTGQSLIG